MKKCPYCAEMIQDEAIVCRYCGRELPKESSEKDQPKILSNKTGKSIWGQGAIVSAILSTLYIISVLINPPLLQGELLVRLTLDLAFTFVFFWLTAVGFLWLWKRFGVALLITLIILGVLGYLIYSARFESSSVSSPIVVPTAPLSYYQNGCILGKAISSEYYSSALNQIICVFGLVTSKQSYNIGGFQYNILPQDQLFSFFIIAPGRDEVHKVIPNAPGILTNAGVGDCIVAIGYPTYQAGNNIFMAFDIRDLSQVTSQLGITSPTVENMVSSCH